MTGFYPPTVTPPTKPLGPFKGMAAVLRNPLELWSQDMFDTDVSVMRWPGQTFITVTDPELAKQVLLDDASAYVKSHYVNKILKPAMGNSLLTAEGESWRVQRRAAAPVFRHEKIAALAPFISAIGVKTAENLLKVPEGSRVDLMHEMVGSTLDIIVHTLFGDPGEIYDRDQIAQDVNTYFETHGNLDIFDYLNFPGWFRRWRNRGNGAIRRLRRTARDVILQGGNSGETRPDLAGLLSLAEDPQTGKKLSMEEVIDNVVTFIGAGHETTALAVSWALFILAHLPSLQEELAQEIKNVCPDRPPTAEDVEKLDLHNRVILETMRLYPPAAAVGRTAIAKTTLGNTSINIHDHITIAVYVIHRHRKYWNEPGMFDPDRFIEQDGAKRHRFAYMPFGGGARICIGMKLALMEATLLLANLTRNLRFSPDPTYRAYPQMSITLRPKGGMPLFVHRAKA